MPHPDAFIERRTAVLMRRYATAIETIQQRWPQGTITFADPTDPVLWVVPATPLDDLSSYSSLSERLTGDTPWACIGDTRDTALTAARRHTTHPDRLHLHDGDVVWITHDTYPV